MTDPSKFTPAAWDAIAQFEVSHVRWLGDTGRADWNTVHVELDRLAAENARLQREVTDGCEAGWHALRNERDSLRQAYWDARAIMGFDNQGDPTPAALVSSMPDMMRRDAASERADYDESLAESAQLQTERDNLKSLLRETLPYLPTELRGRVKGVVG